MTASILPDANITVSHPDTDAPDTETNWAAFVACNDADTIRDVTAQILDSNYATIGGGAAPLTWIFA